MTPLMTFICVTDLEYDAKSTFEPCSVSSIVREFTVHH